MTCLCAESLQAFIPPPLSTVLWFQVQKSQPHFMASPDSMRCQQVCLVISHHKAVKPAAASKSLEQLLRLFQLSHAHSSAGEALARSMILGPDMEMQHALLVAGLNENTSYLLTNHVPLLEKNRRMMPVLAEPGKDMMQATTSVCGGRFSLGVAARSPGLSTTKVCQPQGVHALPRYQNLTLN